MLLFYFSISSNHLPLGKIRLNRHTINIITISVKNNIASLKHNLLFSIFEKNRVRTKRREIVYYTNVADNNISILLVILPIPRYTAPVVPTIVDAFHYLIRWHIAAAANVRVNYILIIAN